MRRATWLVLFGALGLACSKKGADLPDVAVEPGQVKIEDAPPDPLAGKVNALNFSKLWEPEGDTKRDVKALVAHFVTMQFFAKHQTEYLSGTTVGTAAVIGPGGLHAVAALPVLETSYPAVAKKTDETWKDRLVETVSQGQAALDFGTFGTGGASIRVLVYRAKPGPDDELRLRFGAYLTRVEEAVRGTGVTISAHQRGGIRPTGSLSDVRYESQHRVGYVRSVVVRGYDDNDHELKTLVLGDAARDDQGLFKTMLSAEKGPFLVVALKEERR